MTPTNKIVDQFTDLPISPQQKWKLRKKAARLCVLCGKPLNLYWSYCDPCQTKITAKRRVKAGNQPWRPGHVGRPPACHSIKNPVQKAA